MKIGMIAQLEVPKGIKIPKIETYDDVKRFLKKLVLREGEVVRIRFEDDEIVLNNDSLVRMRFEGVI